MRYVIYYLLLLEDFCFFFLHSVIHVFQLYIPIHFYIQQEDTEENTHLETRI